MKTCTIDQLKERYRVVILGAGPAGLAAVNALAGHEEETLVVDSGAFFQARVHTDQASLTSGYGGAGLYSDGKFSLFPSATELWRLSDRGALRAAVSWLEKSLGCGDIPLPADSLGDDACSNADDQSWKLKNYPTIYLTLKEREEWIRQLVVAGAGQCIEKAALARCTFDESCGRFLVTLRSLESDAASVLEADSVIFATGRMGPIELLRLDCMNPVFRRLEVGFRIEQPAEAAFFRDFQQLDPKLTKKSVDGEVEWRTFCACREGEVVYSNTGGLWTVSGRSDCPPTGRSNIGFNTRILNSEVAKRVWPFLHRGLLAGGGALRIPLAEITQAPYLPSSLLNVYGAELLSYARQGVLALLDAFPSLERDGAMIIGPSLEGVGWYPAVNKDLSVPGVPAWVAGDACGKFRGLTGALISGYFCALRYLKTRRTNVCDERVMPASLSAADVAASIPGPVIAG